MAQKLENAQSAIDVMFKVPDQNKMFSFKTLIDDGQPFVLFLETAPSDLKQVESGYNIKGVREWVTERK